MKDECEHYGVKVNSFVTNEDKKHKYYNKARKTWRSMIQRCYDEKLHSVENTYEKCEVCDDWLNFHSFFEWFKENYYELKDETVQLDKDILKKGNCIYCPEYCCFVPHTINSLFTKSNKNRGMYPIGVSWIQRDKKFSAQCNDGHKHRKSLGHYDNPVDAFVAYKIFKEKIIKQIADEYKNVIPKDVYEAMYKYVVEITD